MLDFQGRGKLVDHIRKSYSTSDLRIANAREIEDEQMEGPTIIEDEDELGIIYKRKATCNCMKKNCIKL